MGEPTLFPVQADPRNRQRAVVRKEVYMRAYEAYSEVCGPQEAMIIGNCRSGFGVGELVAFLYARSFPKSEWSKRFDEALEGMNL